MNSRLMGKVYLTFLVLMATKSLYAHDFTSFIAQPDFAVDVDADGSAVPHPSSYRITDKMKLVVTSENYFVKDRFGNRHILCMGPVKKLYRDVVASILSSAIGLKSDPSDPVWVKRGVHGIPSRTVAQTLFSKADVTFTFAPDDVYVPATIKPHGDLETIGRPTVVRPKEMADLLMTISIRYLVGAKESPLAEATEVPIPPSYFDTFPQYRLSKMDRHGQEKFYHQLNLLLTRLEHIDLSVVQSLHASVPQLTQARIKALRSELHELLTSWHVASDPLMVEALQSPITLKSPPHIYLPWHAKRDDDPLRELWNSYFDYASTGHVTTSEKFIQEALERAKKVQSFFGVWSQTDYFFTKTSEDKRRFHSNANNDTTLVVLSSNDKEAKRILSLAKEAGAHTYDLKLGHGVPMSHDDLRKIIVGLGQRGITRILAIELPSFALLWTRLQNRPKGIEVVNIDHHEYEGDDQFDHRSSSMEQLARALGVSLRLEEQLTAWTDRDGVYGLAKAPFSQSALMEISTSNRARMFKDAILATRWSPEKSVFGDTNIHYLPDLPLRFFEYGVAVSAAYAEQGDRQPLTTFGKDVVIMTRSFVPSFLYAGPVDVVTAIDKALCDTKFDHHIRYGNSHEHPVRSVYFDSREDLDLALQHVFAVLRGTSAVSIEYRIAEQQQSVAYRSLLKSFVESMNYKSLNDHKDAVGQILISMSRRFGFSTNRDDQEFLASLHQVVAQRSAVGADDNRRLVDRLLAPAMRMMKRDPTLPASRQLSIALLQRSLNECHVIFAP